MVTNADLQHFTDKNIKSNTDTEKPAIMWDIGLGKINITLKSGNE